MLFFESCLVYFLPFTGDKLFCCFHNPCVQLIFPARSRFFSLLFFWSQVSNGFPVKSIFLEGLSFFALFSVKLIFWIFACALEPWDYHQPRHNQLKLFESSNCRDLTYKVEFFKGATASFPTLFCVRFQFLSPGNEVCFFWWFVGSTIPQICFLLPNWYASWVSLWALAFFFRKTPVFHELSL